MEVDLTEDEIKLMTNLLEQRCEDLRVEVRRTETPELPRYAAPTRERDDLALAQVGEGGVDASVRLSDATDPASF